MAPVTTPSRITTELVGLSDDTRRECQLLAKRRKEGLTQLEAAELQRLQAQAQYADLIHDELTESRSWPSSKRSNFHDL
jgi:hypothetical protein